MQHNFAFVLPVHLYTLCGGREQEKTMRCCNRHTDTITLKTGTKQRKTGVEINSKQNEPNDGKLHHAISLTYQVVQDEECQNI